MATQILSKEAAKQTGRPISLNLSPAAARSRLLCLLASYSGTRALLLESVWRLTGMDKHIEVGFRVCSLRQQNTDSNSTSSSSLQLRRVSTVIEPVMKEYMVVFEEEKQNLYLDPVNESDAWTEVALGMERTTWSQSLCRELREWALDGLEYLANRIMIGDDGPLGPCLKQDIFAIFVQILNGARLALHSTKMISLQSDHEKQDALRGKLEQVWNIGHEKGLHPMILDRVEHLRLDHISSLTH